MSSRSTWLAGSDNIWKYGISISGPSARGDFGQNWSRLEIQVEFPSPTGNMLTSFSFSFINLGYIPQILLKWVSNLPKILNFNRSFLKLNRLKGN